ERRIDILRRQPAPLTLSDDVRERIQKLSTAPAVASSGQDEGSVALQLKRVVKRYGDTEVLKGVDLTVHTGEVICLIGPSGSGKTSLIRTINGLETLSGGEIVLHGESFLKAGPGGNAHPGKRILDIGMVFQSFNLFPHRTVLDNVMLAPEYHKLGARDQLRLDALVLLAKVGMLEHAHKYPHQLS